MDLRIQAMLVVNLSELLVNGKLGVFLEMDDDSCVVHFEVSPGTFIKERIDKYVFTCYSRVTGTNIATPRQSPLRLAHTLPIHKAQGMTIPRLVNAKHATNPDNW